MTRDWWTYVKNVPLASGPASTGAGVVASTRALTPVRTSGRNKFKEQPPTPKQSVAPLSPDESVEEASRETRSPKWCLQGCVPSFLTVQSMRNRACVHSPELSRHGGVREYCSVLGFPWRKTLSIWSLDSVLKAEVRQSKCA